MFLQLTISQGTHALPACGLKGPSSGDGCQAEIKQAANALKDVSAVLSPCLPKYIVLVRVNVRGAYVSFKQLRASRQGIA